MTTLASIPFAPGAILAGKYRVERLLGAGGMGAVVLATHLSLEQLVALKLIHAEHAGNPECVARFLREARAAARIQSEHVARVTDFGSLENGAPYLVMEYLEGSDLDGRIQAARGPLPIAEALDYAMEACEGLAEAHLAGIVHRDLKPANLFLARRNDGSTRVKLLDFGISKLTPAVGQSSIRMTRTQAVMGSPLYCAPEQLRSTRDVDARADIWSMGVILFEMLGGASPFAAETLPMVCAQIIHVPPPPLRSLNAAIPPLLEAVVMRCLEKDPNARFGDVAELARALAACGGPELRGGADRIARMVTRSGGHVAAVAPTMPRPAAQTNVAFGALSTTPPSRPSPAPLIIGGGGLVVAAMAIVMLIALRHRDAPSQSAHAGAPLPATSIVSSSPSASASAAPSASSVTEPPMPSATPVASAPDPAPSSRAPTKPPAAKPAASAKPGATNGFGGRE